MKNNVKSTTYIFVPLCGLKKEGMLAGTAQENDLGLGGDSRKGSCTLCFC
jgi:hypothetical protein